jgi:hypothetical protein
LTSRACDVEPHAYSQPRLALPIATEANALTGFMKISLFALWIFAAALAGCKENPRTKQMESIDWKSL